MKKISILGSTGSIGRNALEVIKSLPGKFDVVHLSAGSNAELLVRQAKEYHPNSVAIANESKYKFVKESLAPLGVKVLAGHEGILNLAKREEIDVVLNAIVGSAGLEPTYHAILSGKNVALANKESLVMAGELIVNLVKRKNVELLPIDSEHSAIWQCLIGESPNSIERIILTGSGGPFRERNFKDFPYIKPEEALKHPTWNMGKKITIDSATMMNKGLEIIEAKWLFDLPPEKIGVIIHPQSIIHSMVEFVDGSIKAQLGIPDMKLPIQYALNYPERVNLKWENTNLAEIGHLTFEDPDFGKFPAIKLAYDALKRGGTAPTILNVVNELAVYAFLENKIKFTDITKFIEESLSSIRIVDNPLLSDILEAEKFGHEFFENKIKK